MTAEEVDRLEAPDVETPQDTLHRLRLEIEELRASRRRLVLGADADRRNIERALHSGTQQHLVALAVNLQLATQLVETDPAVVRTRLKEMGRDVQRALEETARLASRIYPQLLELRGLATELRSAAASAGIRASVDVTAAAGHRPDIGPAVYLCCLAALEDARDALIASGQLAVVVPLENEIRWLSRRLRFDDPEGGSSAH